MTVLRLTFAGEIKKAEHKTAGGKALVEISLCRKNYAKQGDPETFTWIKVKLWEPADFLAQKLVKGAFIAGSGELTSRSYEKDGVKGQSLEVRCSGFDVEMPRDGVAGDVPAPQSAPRRPAPSAGDDDQSPPF